MFFWRFDVSLWVTTSCYTLFVYTQQRVTMGWRATSSIDQRNRHTPDIGSCPSNTIHHWPAAGCLQRHTLSRQVDSQTKFSSENRLSKLLQCFSFYSQGKERTFRKIIHERRVCLSQARSIFQLTLQCNQHVSLLRNGTEHAHRIVYRVVLVMRNQHLQ